MSTAGGGGAGRGAEGEPEGGRGRGRARGRGEVRDAPKKRIGPTVEIPIVIEMAGTICMKLMSRKYRFDVRLNCFRRLSGRKLYHRYTFVRTTLLVTPRGSSALSRSAVSARSPRTTVRWDAPPPLMVGLAVLLGAVPPGVTDVRLVASKDASLGRPTRGETERGVVLGSQRRGMLLGEEG